MPLGKLEFIVTGDCLAELLTKGANLA